MAHSHCPGRGRLVLAAVLSSLLPVAGCGGGGDGATAAAPGGSSAASSAASGAPAGLNEFVSVCASGGGFEKVAAYDAAAAGPHPLVLFESLKPGGDFSQSGRDLPDAWDVVEQPPYEDDSELLETQLVACSAVTATAPTGQNCEFDDDGKKITLALLDATYQITVRAAATGKEVDALTVEATSDGCPFFISYDEGDTEYVTRLSDEQVIQALTPLAAP